MKFKSQVFTEASGSIGGVTYSRNKGGMYTRARAMPVNPGSPLANQIRQYFTNLAQQWRDDLTQPQRTAWDSYASLTPIPDKLGEPRNIGGLPMFIKVNTLALQAGITPILNAPGEGGLTATGVTYPGVSLVDSTGLTTVIDHSPEWARTTGSRCLIYLSPALSGAINYYKGPFRLAGVISGNSGTPVTTNTIAPSSLPFPVVAGAKYFVRATCITATGRPGTPVIWPVVAQSGGG